MALALIDSDVWQFFWNFEQGNNAISVYLRLYSTHCTHTFRQFHIYKVNVCNAWKKSSSSSKERWKVCTLSDHWITLARSLGLSRIEKTLCLLLISDESDWPKCKQTFWIKKINWKLDIKIDIWMKSLHCI